MSRILIIEDNTKNVRMASNILTHYGYAVATALTGEDGYNLAITATFDLILVDLGLPDIDGQTIIAMMRQQHELKATPIVAFTAWAPDVAREMADAYGCDGVICKPIELRSFLQAVSEYMRVQEATL
jgi:two-component system, cell cycle response regulator DivK